MEIENDIAIPPVRRDVSRINGIADKYRLTTLQPKQSFLYKPDEWIIDDLPDMERMRWRIVTYIYQLQKKTPMRWRTRKYSDGIRVWRVK